MLKTLDGGCTDAGVPAAGAVHVLYGTAHGLTGRGSAYFRQGADGVPGSPTANSWFGHPVIGQRAS